MRYYMATNLDGLWRFFQDFRQFIVTASRKFGLTRVVLAAAHLDNNPANNRLSNLRGLCQRCHMLHDRPFHLVQRWLTYRRRWAIGDLFLGTYAAQAPSNALMGTTGRPGASPVHARAGSVTWRVGPRP